MKRVMFASTCCSCTVTIFEMIHWGLAWWCQTLLFFFYHTNLGTIQLDWRNQTVNQPLTLNKFIMSRSFRFLNIGLFHFHINLIYQLPQPWNLTKIRFGWSDKSCRIVVRVRPMISGWMHGVLGLSMPGRCRFIRLHWIPPSHNDEAIIGVVSQVQPWWKFHGHMTHMNLSYSKLETSIMGGWTSES